MHTQVGRLIVMNTTRLILIAALLLAAAGAHAQVVNVHLTPQCNGVDDTIYVVVDGNERRRIPVQRVRSAVCTWTGVDQRSMFAKPGKLTYTLHLGIGRTDCQPAPPATGGVMNLTALVEKRPTHDLKIAPQPPMTFGYLRWVRRRSPSSIPCTEYGGLATKPLPDVDYGMETVMLQLDLTDGDRTRAGLILNDVVATLLTRNDVINALIRQRSGPKANAAPSFSAPAIDLSSAQLTKRGLHSLELTRLEP
jgi:hypothetical protein